MAHQGLWLCGPPGVGKSTVGYEVFVAIYRTGRKAAYVDADQVGMCYPAPRDDPHNHTLKALNVGAVWRNVQPESVEEAIGELALLERTTFADLVVRTKGLSPVDVALRVREQAGGWLALDP